MSIINFETCQLPSRYQDLAQPPREHSPLMLSSATHLPTLERSTTNSPLKNQLPPPKLLRKEILVARESHLDLPPFRTSLLPRRGRRSSPNLPRLYLQRSLRGNEHVPSVEQSCDQTLRSLLEFHRDLWGKLANLKPRMLLPKSSDVRSATTWDILVSSAAGYLLLKDLPHSSATSAQCPTSTLHPHR